MSFRELRDATECLRALGYPRLVSIENFRFPNFQLMSEILEWTILRFDPNHRLPKSIESEADRVIFIKSCVMALIQKARVRLNPKNLYQSDGHAVRELLPILKMLYQAAKGQVSTLPHELEQEGPVQLSALRSQVTAKRQEMRRSLQLSAQLPHIGANIFDLLGKEILAKEARGKALSLSLNSGEVEGAVREKIERAERKTGDVRYKLEHISTDEADLERKIERRRREYDQLQKRLAKLQSFRPPYMDEYDRYELQLKELYGVYVVLFRNLTHLQQQLWEVERNERDRNVDAEKSMRMAVEKMRLDNDSALVNGLQGGEGDVDGEGRPQKEVKVYGNMTGAGLSDDDDEDDEVEGEEEEGERVEGEEVGGGGGMTEEEEAAILREINELGMDYSNVENDEGEIYMDGDEGGDNPSTFYMNKEGEEAEGEGGEELPVNGGYKHHHHDGDHVKEHDSEDDF